ncbi:phosphoglycerate dehydrogenase [Microbulbifer sp. SAOS-129_SWC]|uniref:phosphoglycerate dehydrogenase n=1 Tax=Microbulbifer sp. SAOS-129_SWC TaxID=3145235 RepID=UPI003217CB75
MKKVLVTCPPMLGMLEEFIEPARELGMDLVPAKTTQVLSEEELVLQVPNFDGWIIGDDPATAKVFQASTSGSLKAAVKWGIGVDNVDFAACRDLGLPISNTPNMFGGEVADLAIAYILGLARQSYLIDREIRAGGWPKPPGMSMAGKHVGVVGFGDIGETVVKRLMGFDVRVTVYDPGVDGDKGFSYVERKSFPEGVEELDFLVFTCALNRHNHHMLNENVLDKMQPGVKIVNVARGPLIDEVALVEALESGQVSAAALDVFEMEPLPQDSKLRSMSECIFGSHNGSNTKEGVRRASFKALEILGGYLANA